MTRAEFDKMFKEAMESAYVSVSPQEAGLVDEAQMIHIVRKGQWYLPNWGCDTLQHLYEDLADQLTEAGHIT